MTVVLLSASTTPLLEADLTPGEADQLSIVKGSARRRSWLIARRALRHAMTVSGRTTDSSQYRLPSPVVSLSHSAELAVAAVPAGPSAVAGIGVDVELDQRPDPRTARFFLSPHERCQAADRPSELLRLWTVKEALYKADPGNADTTLYDYVLDDPTAHSGGARRGGGPSFHYRSIPLLRGSLSVAVTASTDIERTDPMAAIDYQQVAQRISKLTGVPASRLTPEVTVAELVPDSFMFVEVAVDLQEEFDVVLTQQHLKNIATVGDLVAVLQDQQQTGTATS